MNENYEIDNLDREIITALIKDARTPFLELGRKLNVSAGTIHVRVEKLRKAGVITGSQLKIDAKKLGMDVCCFIGIILRSANDYQKALEHLRDFSEVTEVHYTTGNYSLFIKVITKNIDSLYQFLSAKLQAIKEIQSTETFISLQSPVQREITW